MKPVLGPWNEDNRRNDVNGDTFLSVEDIGYDDDLKGTIERWRITYIPAYGSWN